MRNIGLLIGLSILLCGAGSMPVHAQTIGSQYERYLGNKCSQLRFSRDGGGQISEGQATGALLAHCNGLAAPTDLAIDVPGNLWDDPIRLVDPVAMERISAMPDWRDRTIRQQPSRRARRNGQQPTEHQSDYSIFVGLRPGVVTTDEGSYESGVEDGASLSPVLGANYWVNDNVHVSVAGGHRERGYVVGTSAVWTPSEQAFAELKLTFDTTAPSSDRTFLKTRTTGSQGNSFVALYGTTATSKPRVETWAAEFHSGYEVQVGHVLLGPRFGIKYRGSQLEAYSESAPRDTADAIPLALSFNAATIDSLVHAMGFGVGLRSKRHNIYGPQIELLWAHEYLDVERRVTARFAEDTRPDPTEFTFRGEASNRNSVRGRLGFGVGVSSRFTVFTTGEANYEGRSFYMSGIVGVRCKL